METVRIAAFVRIATLLSAIWTSLVAAPILGWQIVSWAFSGEWYPFPISRALALAGFGAPAIYETASSTERAPVDLTENQEILGWLLEFPTVGLLLVVAAIFFAFSKATASIQKQHAAIKG